MGGEALCPLGRIAAQGDDFGHTRRGIAFRNLKRFRAGCVDAGQVRRDVQPVILADGADRLMRQLAGRAARTIGDRDEVGLHRGQRLHRFPQPEGRIQRLRREEFERDAGRRGHIGHSI